MAGQGRESVMGKGRRLLSEEAALKQAPLDVRGTPVPTYPPVFSAPCAGCHNKKERSPWPFLGTGLDVTGLPREHTGTRGGSAHSALVSVPCNSWAIVIQV